MVHVKKGLGNCFKRIDRPYLRRDLVVTKKGENVRHDLLGGVVGEKAGQIYPVGNLLNGVKAM